MKPSFSRTLLSLLLASWFLLIPSHAQVTPGFTPGITTQPVNKGGTGATTATGARSNLGLGSADSPVFTDLTLGTSGPSLNSTLNARAPRQGLIFDGSAAGTMSVTVGSGDFTAAVWITPTGVTGTQNILNGSNNAFQFKMENNTLQSALSGVANNTATSACLTAGKAQLVSYTKSGSTGTYYVNGVSVGTTTDSRNYSVATTAISAAAAGFIGTISGPLIYNRALSASEITALWESGVPAAADFNSASNTSLITGDNSTFASDTGYWSKQNGATIAAGSCTLPQFGYIQNSSLLTIGKRYRAVGVTTAGAASFNDGVNNSGAPVANPTWEFVAAGTTFNVGSTDASGATIDSVVLYPLGCLLCLDPSQPGSGTTWYDISGNAANVTWTTGVSWAVPSSGTGTGKAVMQNSPTLTTPILSTATPASAAATGTTGTIVWDGSYIYICVATDTWKRVAIATW